MCSVCTTNKIGFGKIPNNMELITNESQFLDSKPEDLANEIKYAILAGQNMSRCEHPCLLLATRSQENNMKCDALIEDLVDLVEKHPNFLMLNISLDVLASERKKNIQ